jgi:hypothetical protein
MEENWWRCVAGERWDSLSIESRGEVESLAAPMLQSSRVCLNMKPISKREDDRQGLVSVFELVRIID